MKFKKSYIPNLLTFLRIALIIPIFILFSCARNGNNILVYSFYEDSKIYLFEFISGIFFVIASITDFLDGYIARKYNWVSSIGKVWDPIADKLLINTVLVSFTWLDYVPMWLVIFNIFRDVIVDGVRQYAASKGIILHSNWVGKWKTTLQMVGFIIIFFVLAFPHSKIDSISDGLIYWFFQNGLLIVSTFLAYWSAFLYYIKLRRTFYMGSY